MGGKWRSGREDDCQDAGFFEESMTTKLLAAFGKWANWKSILVLFALQMLFNLVILPGASTNDKQDLPILDLHFWYTPQRLYEVIAAYPPELLRSAAIGRLTVDMIYPLVYGLLISFLLTVTFRRAFQNYRFADFSLFIPWGGVLGDYLENIGLATMYLSYPTKLVPLAWFTAIFTAAKWTLIGIAFVLVLIGAVKLIFARFQT